MFAEIKEQNPNFGTSLLLANIGTNSTETPKIVNGSFAALFDSSDVVQDFSKRLQDLGMEAKDSGKYLINLNDSKNCQDEGHGSDFDLCVIGWIRPWVLKTMHRNEDFKTLPKAVSTWGPKIPPAIGMQNREKKGSQEKKEFILFL